jgi:putative protease
MASSKILKRPELLVPAGNLEKLKTAVYFGADAVYLGGEDFCLRARAGNFSTEAMGEAIRFAHGHKVKVYVAINAFARNEDMDRLPAYLDVLKELGPDAVIVSDPGVVRLVLDRLPDMPIHLGTQANTTNWASCEFWRGEGVERVGLARELSLREIREVRKKTSVELEVFVHGAMCISYSGRCWMSKFMANRDANRGDCSQSCRWEYFLMESKRPGEFFPVDGDEKGTYLFNSKDLCLLDGLPDLMEAGVDAFKIEGRMKTAFYAGVVTNVYRAAIDSYFAAPATFSVLPEWREELASVSHRGYTTAFFHGEPKDDRLLHTFAPYRSYDFVGVVCDPSPTGQPRVEVKNRFSPGDEVEVVGRGLKIQRVAIEKILDGEGKSLAAAKPNTDVFISLNVGAELERNSLIRKRKCE